MIFVGISVEEQNWRCRFRYLRNNDWDDPGLMSPEYHEQLLRWLRLGAV
jgi:hypothetical protein